MSNDFAFSQQVECNAYEFVYGTDIKKKYGKSEWQVFDPISK